LDIFNIRNFANIVIFSDGILIFMKLMTTIIIDMNT
jgi:hypothetical protein